MRPSTLPAATKLCQCTSSKGLGKCVHTAARFVPMGAGNFFLAAVPTPRKLCALIARRQKIRQMPIFQVFGIRADSWVWLFSSVLRSHTATYLFLRYIQQILRVDGGLITLFAAKPQLQTCYLQPICSEAENRLFGDHMGSFRPFCAFKGEICYQVCQ